MDTVQNIASVVMGASARVGGVDASGHGAASVASPMGTSLVNANAGIGLPPAAPSPTSGGSQRPRPIRSEFLSRPNWLFTHNENVLFCTALNALRFPDQNNVPRKFIEEWLADRMVTMETQWPAGSKFLSDTIRELEREKAKFEEKRDREIHQRQREFHKNRKQALHIAERAYKSARTAEQADKARQVYEEAKIAAEQPVGSIEVQPPSPEEIALIELQTKIVRRLQGQTDRLSMAEHLANKPYEQPAADYFKSLQDDVLRAIADKHDEISEEREKVETKSKQSRKRRRNQVANGLTMSGSATRVRFTNREIAMLIHWIYTYPKSEWAARIFEFYTHPGTARSAEHVRDKMRDLITRSRDTERGGLTTMKTRSAISYFGKPSEPIEMLRLSQHDLQDFKYPDGPLDYTPTGRYFDEERAMWVEGMPPKAYINRYHEEITRIQAVVKSKVMRTREHGVLASDESPVPTSNNANYDTSFLSADNPILGSHGYRPDNNEFTLATREIHEAFMLPPKTEDHKDLADDVNGDPSYFTALASAALKPEYLQSVSDGQVSVGHVVPTDEDAVSALESEIDKRGPAEKKLRQS